MDKYLVFEYSCGEWHQHTFDTMKDAVDFTSDIDTKYYEIFKRVT